MTVQDVEEVIPRGTGVVKERPSRPMQIRNAEEIEPGMILASVHHQREDVTIFQVIKKDIEVALAGRVVKKLIGTRPRYYHKIVETDVFYADHGLVPYPAGWNASNYLRHATDEEVSEFLDKMKEAKE